MNLIGTVTVFLFKIAFFAFFVAWCFSAYYMLRFRAADGFKVIAWFGECASFPENVQPYCRKCRKCMLIGMVIWTAGLVIGLIGHKWGGGAFR